MCMHTLLVMDGVGWIGGNGDVLTSYASQAPQNMIQT